MRQNAPQSQHSPASKSLVLPAERLGPLGPIHQARPEIPQPLSVLIHECLELSPSKRRPMAWVAKVLQQLQEQYARPAAPVSA